MVDREKSAWTSAKPTHPRKAALPQRLHSPVVSAGTAGQVTDHDMRGVMELTARELNYVAGGGQLQGAAGTTAPKKVNGVELKKLDASYRLEKLDPKHRPGAVLDMLVWIAAQQPDVADRPFFPWVDSLDEFTFKQMYNLYWEGKPPTPDQFPQTWKAFQSSVMYCTASEAATFRVNVEQGGRVSSVGQFITTEKDAGLLGANGVWIWVMSRDYELYSAPHQLNRLHHSSFLAGRALLGGGEWRVHEGRVKALTGKTGHYKIDGNRFVEALKRMLLQGIDLSAAEVLSFQTTTPSLERWTPVAEFLQMASAGGDYRLFPSGAWAAGKAPTTPRQAVLMRS